MKKRFKISTVSEGGCGTILFGSSSLPVEKMQKLMNDAGQSGWDISFINIEKKRYYLFWERETAIITFSKPIE